ncbi:TetR/AcrR family transcriptional regulator [Escherichia coli]|uniref:TetR/AcrR family transcriptional regulator n=1 Tax=Escherichia coli TaxID=562 RepID=UPI001FF549C7|nr:TetR/AcrR family transcriptional regulator [Escherichia coli]
MVTKKQSRVPGRPRRFAPEQAVSAAKVLFHQKGFDAVSVAEVTDYLGINPPSLYAAFGSKVGLFSRVLNEYVGTEAIPLADILRDDRPVGECLVEVLKEAARRYSQNGGCAGCMVFEGIHSHDPQARDIAVQYYHAAETTIYDYIARRHPQSAQCVTDFMSTVMSGLSAKAREGHSIEQLCATAALAGEAIKTILKE